MAIGFLAGAGGGALAASGAGVFVQAVGGAAIAMTSNAAQQANKMYISKKQESFDVGDMLCNLACSLYAECRAKQHPHFFRDCSKRSALSDYPFSG